MAATVRRLPYAGMWALHQGRSWWELPFEFIAELTAALILWPLYNWITRRELKREKAQIMAR